jgi:hypothetical protein
LTTKAPTEWWGRLREPFPPEVIGKLPRISCFDCSTVGKTAKRARDKHCDRHEVKQCSECGNYLTTAHIHLDYVGHATTTDRLLKVDPAWSWKPMATEPDTGFPKFDSSGGLWILLTIHGVTRPGYGDGNSPKVVIGDAIRNAAMRFGVALDLWAKEDLQAVEESTLDVKEPDREFINDDQRTKLTDLAGPDGFRMSADQLRDVIEECTGQRNARKIRRYQFDAVLAAVEMAGRGMIA